MPSPSKAATSPVHLLGIKGLWVLMKLMQISFAFEVVTSIGKMYRFLHAPVTNCA